jgi:hypothetical protein
MIALMIGAISLSGASVNFYQTPSQKTDIFILAAMRI